MLSWCMQAPRCLQLAHDGPCRGQGEFNLPSRHSQVIGFFIFCLFLCHNLNNPTSPQLSHSFSLSHPLFLLPLLPMYVSSVNVVSSSPLISQCEDDSCACTSRNLSLRHPPNAALSARGSLCPSFPRCTATLAQQVGPCHSPAIHPSPIYRTPVACNALITHMTHNTHSLLTQHSPAIHLPLN